MFKTIYQTDYWLAGSNEFENKHKRS